MAEVSIRENPYRIGNFTSSGIWQLMTFARDKVSFGAPALNYVREKRMERKLGRPLGVAFDTKPTLWGKLCEKQVFELLGLEYKYTAQDTIVHPEHSFWAGSPDAEKVKGKNKTIVDIKCPFTLKSFCIAHDSKDIDEFRDEHSDGDKYYWQIVSNAILNGATFGELVFYCPYQDELDVIRDKSVNVEYEKLRNEYAWIFHSMDSELPYLLRKGEYKNLKKILWKIDEADKMALTARIIEAEKQLLNHK